MPTGKHAWLVVAFSLAMAACTNQVAAGPLTTTATDMPCKDYEEDGFISYDGKFAFKMSYKNVGGELILNLS